MKITVGISCCLCSEAHVASVDLPDGWDHRYEGTDSDQGFCPKHAPINAFAHSQCPGCVGGWGDCNMWRAFAYSGRDRDVGPADYSAIEQGVCPRRTNGTIGVDTRKRTIETIDLSERASPESGKAFAQAIREYVAKYP